MATDGDEIALVLDTTGSMANEMTWMRAAASDFAERVMDGTRKVAVVPFVGAVNVGPGNLAMRYMDTGADSRWHGAFFKDKQVGSHVGCSGYVPTRRSDIRPGDLPGSGGPTRFSEILTGLFGITSARADVTPRTRPAVPGSTTGVTSPSAPLGTQAFVPDGWWLTDGGCGLMTPPKVSHFDLFARIPGARWKGCVEARPEPYDMTDDVPVSGNPDTLFVPYFAPDEPGDGRDPAGGTYSNDYLADSTFLADGTTRPATPADVGPVKDFRWTNTMARIFNPLKYDDTTAPVPTGLQETSPLSFGPNKACPDEMVRLTTNKASVKSRIISLKHWNSGGTVGSEGIAWGWRALSPNAPLADGVPYGTRTSKSIVFLTDGINTLAGNGSIDGRDITSWSAYGALVGSAGRFGSGTASTRAEVDQFLDGRMRAVCDNAKARGVKIYTILFKEHDAASVNLMKGCASDPVNGFFQVDTRSELDTAFVSIAGTFSTVLRLTK